MVKKVWVPFYLMKRELLVHFSFFVSFFIFISLFKGWLAFSYWGFWVGGLIGTILPDVDHLIYIYFLRPQELTSQRVNYMLGKKDLWGSLDLLSKTRSERKELIFHTILFQLIFFVLTFFVITSSNSLVGRGLVLAFSLHLLTDQMVDKLEMGNLNDWFERIPFYIKDNWQNVYWVALLVFLLIFGFFF